VFTDEEEKLGLELRLSDRRTNSPPLRGIGWPKDKRSDPENADLEAAPTPQSQP